MQLCQLAAKRRNARREHAGHGFERCSDAMGRLIEQKRSRHRHELLQAPHALARLTRQEPLEKEMVTRYPRCNERCHAGHRTGNDLHRHACLSRRVHEHLPGVRHPRHARIGCKGERLARQHAIDQGRGAPSNHVLVTANERPRHARRREQLPRHTRIFAAHGAGRAERLDRAGREVAQITDRRSYNEEFSLVSHNVYEVSLVEHRALKRTERSAGVPCRYALLGLPGLEEPAIGIRKRSHLVRDEHALVCCAALGRD